MAALLASLGGAGGETDRSLPAGFLMEMMETRERMEEELNSGDESTRRKNAEAWERWGREKRDEAVTRAGELFERATATNGAEKARTLSEIRTHLNAWRYVERLLEQARGARPM